MLIVIVIIGILSAVVLTAIGPSRNKAKDAKIISDLNQIRTSAEVFYNNNGTYNNFQSTTDYTSQQTDVQSVGGTLQFNISSDGNQYAAYSVLTTTGPSGNTQYYCVDSAGATVTSNNSPGTNVSCSAAG